MKKKINPLFFLPTKTGSNNFTFRKKKLKIMYVLVKYAIKNQLKSSSFSFFGGKLKSFFKEINTIHW